MNTLTIKSQQGDYDVTFWDSIPELAGGLLETRKALVMADRNIARLYEKQLSAVLSAVPVHWIDANEDEKTLEGCARALTFLQRENATRQTTIIAVGGGIVQDIVTFCAHVYYRGLRWIYVPTTLLGMADSCIGAKASINFNHYKNQLGAFHSPAAVRICLAFVETLAEQDLRSGYGEIAKLHLTGSRALFRDLVETVGSEGLRGPGLARFVRQSLEVKKRVIEQDEYERDLRRILNYGHTFGHALEAVTEHAIPHGLAVAWGVDLANLISLRSGLLGERDFDDIHGFLARQLAARLPGPIDENRLLDATRRDKKVLDGNLNLILLKEPGDLRIVSTRHDGALARLVSEYCSGMSIASSG